jgi:hypothetical protein
MMRETRTIERLRSHFEIEVELADRLRTAGPEERRRLYGRVYDELFERVPDHLQLTRRAAAAEQAAYAEQQVALIRQILPPGGSYLEVGAGDCATVLRVAEFARGATAVEVSADIVPRDLPPNVDVATAVRVASADHDHGDRGGRAARRNRPARRWGRMPSPFEPRLFRFWRRGLESPGRLWIRPGVPPVTNAGAGRAGAPARRSSCRRG